VLICQHIARIGGKEMKRLILALCVGVLSLGVVILNAAAKEAGHGKSVEDWPVGVTVHNPEKAYNGFTIFTSLGGDGTHYLIDMKGKTVHTWKMKTSHYGWLLPNGNLFSGEARNKGLGTAETNTPAVANVGVVYEADWDGKILREWKNDAIHHDYDLLPNGNIIAILWSKHKRPQEMIGGRPGSEYPGGVILSETIAEINTKGEIVWSCVAEDHMKPEDYPVCPLDYRQRSLHANSIQDLTPDNPIFPGKELILVSNRQPSACIIIDKGTGEIVWRYGGYKEGEWARLGHQHSFYMIGAKTGGKELPGYGNLIVYDNGMHIAAVEDWGLPRSKVPEIDPKTKKIVWAYTHKEKFTGWMPPEWKFNSPYIAGAQRLPNGNTLICEGGTGRIFEVTKEGEIVWEFINPERRALFRAYRYGPDFAGFKGKNLPKPY
jgi:hypothetical protein